MRLLCKNCGRYWIREVFGKRGKQAGRVYVSSWVLSFVVLLLAGSTVGCRETTVSEMPTAGNPVRVVGVTQIASHPSLDAVRSGFYEGMRAKGWKEGESIEYIFRNANRDPSLTVPIIENFVARNVDLIVPITTPSALAATQVTKTVPIVFAGVTDPVGVGIVPRLEAPGGNVTGTSDRWPFEAQLDLFRRLVPSLDCLAMIYSPGDEVSRIAVDEMRSLAALRQMEFRSLPVSGAQDLYSAARQILRDCDSLYTGLDTLVVENFESVLKAAQEANRPVFAGDPETVGRGAVATFGVSMEELGFETAVLADRVLRGESPGSISVVVVSGGRPYINVEAAERAGIKVPLEIRKEASLVQAKRGPE